MIDGAKIVTSNAEQSKEKKRSAIKKNRGFEHVSLILFKNPTGTRVKFVANLVVGGVFAVEHEITLFEL
jgi:hypothetical protein